jgi:hypothetical protein
MKKHEDVGLPLPFFILLFISLAYINNKIKNGIKSKTVNTRKKQIEVNKKTTKFFTRNVTF